MAFSLDDVGGYGDSTRDANYYFRWSEVYSDYLPDVAFDVCMAAGESVYDTDIITDGAWGLDSYDTMSEITDGIHETNVLFSYNGCTYTDGGQSAIDDLYLNVGDELLIHNVALKDPNCTDDAVLTKLGSYQFVKLVEEPKSDWGTGERKLAQYYDDNHVKIYFDRYITVDLDHFYVQAVLVHRYRNFTINGTYDGFKMGVGNYNQFCGGIRVIKCNGTLTFNQDAKIDLTGCGWIPDNAQYRTLMPIESGGVKDTDSVSGTENYNTKNRWPINVGDGTLVIIAKNIVFNGGNRIGNPDTAGVQYCRGATDSPNLPSGVTNIGGSTIAIISEKITGWEPAIIAKYRTGSADDGKGKGLARAYIATTYQGTMGSLINTDEGLYALDNISQPNLLTTHCAVKSFGNGTLNATLNGGTAGNAYGIISNDNPANAPRVTSRIVNTSAKNFTIGTLCMAHVLYKEPTANLGGNAFNGSFSLCRITGINGDIVTVNGKVNDTWYSQLITIPEYRNLKITGTLKGDAKFQDSDASANSFVLKGAGGILALAVSGTLDIRDAILDVTGMGTDRTFVNELEGNAFMSCRLPIGAGHGSVFLLANEIIMNANTRIGAPYTGNNRGGSHSTTDLGGGYKGTPVYVSGVSSDITLKLSGWGGGGGKGYTGSDYSFDPQCDGGWHGNCGLADAVSGGRQGAHIFIVANKITGFNLAAISTGGEAGYDKGRDVSVSYNGFTRNGTYYNMNGGAGYGGGTFVAATGGFHGGAAGKISTDNTVWIGGGAAGAAFIYCNEYEDADFSGVLTC